MDDGSDEVAGKGQGIAGRVSAIFRGTFTGLFHSFVWILLLLGAILIGAAVWVRTTFGPVLIDQILLNLPGAAGAEETDIGQEYVSSFIWTAIVIPILAILSLAAIVLIARGILMLRRQLRLRRSESASAVHAENGSTRPRLVARRWLQLGAAVSVLAIGAVTFSNTVQLWQYIRSITANVTMADYYAPVDTENDHLLTVSDDASAGGTSHTNLVLIYLESTEDTFTNTDLFDRNLLQPLEEATEGWDSVSALQTYRGGGWTMAGIVGSQCGVPLRGAEFSRNDIASNDIGQENSGYLSGAKCLGDVLQDAGYANVFMGGADLNFAAKGSFLQDHGYDRLLGLDLWWEYLHAGDLGEEDFGPWGFSDRGLMAMAKEEIVRLHESGQPFNLTMLTVDTHEPVHFYDYCQPVAGPGLESVINCSANQVADFISFMEEMGYLEDTAVVLMGDHPKMLGEGGELWDELKDVDFEDRTLFNRIWSPTGASISRQSGDQLSMYATMLDLLALGREDGQAGVGVSLLRSEIPTDSALALDEPAYQELLASRSSDLYRRLWGSEIIEAAP